MIWTSITPAATTATAARASVVSAHRRPAKAAAGQRAVINVKRDMLASLLLCGTNGP
jgi:hypothetical protein